MGLFYRRYTPRSFLLLLLCIVFQLFVVTDVWAQTPQTDSRPALLTDAMTKAQASEALALTQNALKALPAESSTDSPEGQRRTALQLRLTLLEEYLGLLAKAAALAGQKQNLASRLQHVQEQRTRLARETALQELIPPSTQGLEKLTTTVSEQRDQVSNVRKTISDRNRWLEGVPLLIPAARARAEKADKRAQRLIEESAIATNEADKKRPGYWGIDQQAFKALDEIHIYGIRGVGDAQEYVTAADVVRAVLLLVVTFWLLRGLSGIYEFAVLPRLRLDEGMKYAVLTLSRYSIFIVGILLILSELHLDLGRLGQGDASTAIHMPERSE